ncbi:HNH endonuclease signature motif containing protein [Actinomadura alba]|uniref:HNH endonuclease signature motif containing protein n=2 Tax=Actinomadura alba TaxID=406431 RepID=UPI0031D78775
MLTLSALPGQTGPACLPVRSPAYTQDHARPSTIAHAVNRLNDDDTAAAEASLLDLKDQGFSAGQVARAGERIGEVVADRDDTEEPPPEAKRPFKRSWVEKSKSLDGAAWVKGWLSPEDAAIFDEVLEPLATPTGAGDDRDHAQRVADALISVLSQGHQRSPITIIAPLDTLEGSGTPGRLPDGTPIPPQRVRQLALNAGVSALILGPDGHPLYLGRTTRFATPRQRQVLRALYATCVVDGCDIPTGLCEIHHTDGWKLGSPTDIDKLAPACGFHNRWIEDNPDRVCTIRDANGRYTIHCLPPWDAKHHESDTRRGRSSRPSRPQEGDRQPEGP